AGGQRGVAALVEAPRAAAPDPPDPSGHEGLERRGRRAPGAPRDRGPPPLVVPARQDRVFLVEYGRYLAAHIPDARLVEYDGETLLFFAGVDESMDAIEEFVTGAVRRPAADRVLATVVFTDIVG